MGFRNACVRDVERRNTVWGCVRVCDCATRRAEGVQGMQRHPRLQQSLELCVGVYDCTACRAEGAQGMQRHPRLQEVLGFSV